MSRFFSVRKMLLFIFVCVCLIVFKVSYSMYSSDKMISDEVSTLSYWECYFSDRLDSTNSNISSLVQTYYNDEYDLGILVNGVVDLSEGDTLNIKVSVSPKTDKGSIYSFNYIKEDKKVSVVEDYGSRMTSLLLSERLNELLKKEIPKNATLWVVTNSLSSDKNIKYSEIGDIIKGWEIADIVSYNASNFLIKDINMTILGDSGYKLRNYKKNLLTIAKTLNNSGVDNPTLNVGFFRGKNGRDFVLGAIADRSNVVKDTIDFTINWYDEIPKIISMEKYMYGAIHIGGSAIDVLTTYYEEDIDTYKLDGSDEFKVLYKTVKELTKGLD